MNHLDQDQLNASHQGVFHSIFDIRSLVRTRGVCIIPIHKTSEAPSVMSSFRHERFPRQVDHSVPALDDVTVSISETRKVQIAQSAAPHRLQQPGPFKYSRTREHCGR
jgi:hypothetical protein